MQEQKYVENAQESNKLEAGVDHSEIEFRLCKLSPDRSARIVRLIDPGVVRSGSSQILRS